MGNDRRACGRRILRAVLILYLAGAAAGTTKSKEEPAVPDPTPPSSDPLNPNPPAQPVRLIFIHHSTGENWLSDENGGFGRILRDNNYFVSDTNYGWGPDAIGDRTDIGNWWEWFRGPSSATYLNALYSEGAQNCSYSRLSPAPSGANEIILFKSCFPNSALQGSPDDPVPAINENPLRGEGSGSEYHTVANAKGIYIDLLEYFETRQDKLFVVITAPPLSDPTYAANARAFNQWLINDWLKDYPDRNVAVFDFYNVLTTNGGGPDTNDLNQETGNHHRFWQTAIQHKTDGDDDGNPDILEYPSGDDHPSRAGNLKATGEFTAWLNVTYHLWKTDFVTSPNGGEQWTVGSSQTIRWTTSGSCPMVKVELSTNNGSSWSTITAETANSGTHPWTVPGSISSQCRIRVSDSTDGVPADMSNNAFSIVAVQSSTLTVTKPNGGESWVAGSAHDITWSSTGTVANMKIEYSTNGGASFTSIAASTANDGIHPWTLPSAVSSNCLIRISNAANAAVNDMSNGTFSIVAMASQRLTWTPGYSGSPAIAVEASGKLHVVWQDNTPGNYEVYYKKSTNGGVTWTASKRLTYTSGFSGAPAIAADSSGNPHVVWQDNTPGNYEVYYKKSTDGGATWTTSKRFTYTSGPSQNPDVSVDASGNPHVVWQDDASGNEEIYYKKSSDRGTSWAANKRLTWTSGGSGFPTVGTGPSGRVHLVWREYTAGNYEVYFRRSTNGGLNWTASQRLTWNSGASEAPAIGLLPSGNPHVIWQDNTPGDYEVYYAKSADAGVTWAANQRLTWTSGASNSPDIAVGPTSHVSAVWADPTPGNSEIYLKRSANWGTSWTANKRLTWTSGGSEVPAIGVDSSGNLHIVWQDNTPGNDELYYLKF